MLCPYPPYTRFALGPEIHATVVGGLPEATLLIALGLVAAAIFAVVVLGRAVRRIQVLSAAALSAIAPMAAWGLGADGSAPVTLEAAGRGAGGALLIAASCALLWAAYRVGRRF
jgi:hypothetical protein